MRQLAIAILGIWLATAATAHAGGDFGKLKKAPAGVAAAPFDSSALRPSPGFGAPKSYAPSSPSSFSTPTPPKPIGSMESFGGGKPFKPFKGTSTYEGPGAFKPYKPPKMKSVYDH